ncbi:MAG: VOC family protein [Pseudonocardiales bacterium]
MSSKIFLNLPVKNTDASIAFFTRLGFTVNEQFTSPDSGCLVVSDDIYVMLLSEPHFKQFTKKPIVDAAVGTEVIIALGVDTKQQVDELVDAALSAGAAPANDTNDQGLMYGRSFQDPDGHQWEVIWLDPAAIP